MKDRCLFVDVSHYQPNMDWEVLAQNQVTGVIAKATSGSYRQDPLFGHHVQGAHKAGLVIGAYHWCDPTCDDLTQARFFLEAVREQPVSFLAIDMEQYWMFWSEFFARNIESVFSGTRISENAYRITTYLQEHSRLPLIVYTRASFVTGRAPEASTWLPHMPLWLAYYPYSRVRISTNWNELKEKYLPIPLGPLIPPNCTEWTFWQFSGDKFRLDGSNGSLLDLNYFNGSRGDLDEFLRTGRPVPPGTVPELPRKAQTLARLNVRREPHILPNTWVGSLPKGEIVDVFEVKWIGMDKWARIGDNRWAAMEYQNVRLMIWV